MNTSNRTHLVMVIGFLAVIALAGCDQPASYNRTEQPPGQRTAGETVDDKTLASRVKDALEEDPTHKYPDVTVTVFKGTVQLSGFVNQDEQKSQAADVAKNVQGVKDVENNISIKK